MAQRISLLRRSTILTMSIYLKCQLLYSVSKQKLTLFVRDDACFFGQSSNSIYGKYVRETVTPGICNLRLPFLPDHTLALPPSFDNVNTSQVRFMTLDDAATAMHRYERVVRKELETPSELDRFCALPDSKVLLFLQQSRSVYPLIVVHYESWCLGAEWYCNKYGLEQPPVIGVQIEDTDTGEWSFVLMSYGFIWRDFPTYVAHFSSASQMASLIKALSDCKKLHYPRLGDLLVNNVPLTFAEEYGLPFSPKYYSDRWVPVIRLPVTAEHPHRSDKPVHWVGRGNFASTTRG